MDQNTTSKIRKIAFIQASWHADIVGQSRAGFVDEIARGEFRDARIEIFTVPGVFEIPLLAKRVANLAQYDAIIGAGFVVDGGIYRHEFVASSVINALMQVQLETDVPILCVVLVPHNFHENKEHHQFYFDHMQGKGREAARACAELFCNSLNETPDADNSILA